MFTWFTTHPDHSVLPIAGLEAVVNAGVFWMRKCKLCTDDDGIVVKGEYGLSTALVLAGHNIATLLSKYRVGIDWRDPQHWGCNDQAHPSRHGTYDHISMHPFETVFVKASWHVGQPHLDHYSDWLWTHAKVAMHFSHYPHDQREAQGLVHLSVSRVKERGEGVVSDKHAAFGIHPCLFQRQMAGASCCSKTVLSVSLPSSIPPCCREGQAHRAPLTRKCTDTRSALRHRRPILQQSVSRCWTMQCPRLIRLCNLAHMCKVGLNQFYFTHHPNWKGTSIGCTKNHSSALA